MIYPMRVDIHYDGDCTATSEGWFDSKEHRDEQAAEAVKELLDEAVEELELKGEDENEYQEELNHLADLCAAKEWNNYIDTAVRFIEEISDNSVEVIRNDPFKIDYFFRAEFSYLCKQGMTPEQARRQLHEGIDAIEE